MNWIKIDQHDHSTWPPPNAMTLNWNDEWYVEEDGSLREQVEEAPEHYDGIKYLVLPEGGLDD